MNKNTIKELVVSALLTIGSVLMLLNIIWVGCKCITDGGSFQILLGWALNIVALVMSAMIPDVLWGKPNKGMHHEDEVLRQV